MFAVLFVCNMIARGVQAMPDHSVLDTLREVPPDGIMLTCWRRSCETLTRHRCPVFDDSIGLTFEIMMGDVLHCLYLGTFQSWLAAAFANLVKRNVWKAPPSYPPLGKLEFSLERFKQRLLQWYNDFSQAHPELDITSVQELTEKWFGERKVLLKWI